MFTFLFLLLAFYVGVAVYLGRVSGYLASPWMWPVNLVKNLIKGESGSESQD